MKHFDVISGSRSAAIAGDTFPVLEPVAATTTAVETATTALLPACTKPNLVAARASSLSSLGGPCPSCDATFAAAAAAADVATLCVLSPARLSLPPSDTDLNGRRTLGGTTKHVVSEGAAASTHKASLRSSNMLLALVRSP